MAAKPLRRIPLTELNPHLICVLCKGYYIDATTIIECLHSFCKSCIVRYFHSSVFCPICDVQVHKTRPLLSLREDRTLQDVVYKLVPGLFEAEMDRRASFYANNPHAVGDKTEQSLREKRHFFHVDDQISLSLEYLPPAHAHAHVLGLRPIRAHYATRDATSLKLSAALPSSPLTSLTNGKDEAKEKIVHRSNGSSSENKTVGQKQKGTEDEVSSNDLEMELERQRHEEEAKTSHRRFLKCPASSTIRLLAKFIRLKYNLSIHHQVDIMHAGDCLCSDLTLLDVVYMYKWNEDAPLKFLYTVVAPPTVPSRKRVKPNINYKPRTEQQLQPENKEKLSPQKSGHSSPNKDNLRSSPKSGDEKLSHTPTELVVADSDVGSVNESDNSKRKEMENATHSESENGSPHKKIRTETIQLTTSVSQAEDHLAKTPKSNETNETRESCNSKNKSDNDAKATVPTAPDDNGNCNDVDEAMDCDSVNNQTIDSLDSSRDDGEGRMVIDESAQSPSDEDSTPPTTSSPRPESSKIIAPEQAKTSISSQEGSDSDPGLESDKNSKLLLNSDARSKKSMPTLSPNSPRSEKMNGTLIAAPEIPMVSIPRPLPTLTPYSIALNNNNVVECSEKRKDSKKEVDPKAVNESVKSPMNQINKVVKTENNSEITPSAVTSKAISVSSPSVANSVEIQTSSTTVAQNTKIFPSNKIIAGKDKLVSSKPESILNKTITKLSLAAAKANAVGGNVDAQTGPSNQVSRTFNSPPKAESNALIKSPVVIPPASLASAILHNPPLSSNVGVATTVSKLPTNPDPSAALAEALVNNVRQHQQHLAQMHQQKILQQLQQQNIQETQDQLQHLQQQQKLLRQKQYQQLVTQSSQPKVKFENLKQMTLPRISSPDARRPLPEPGSTSGLVRSPFPAGFPYNQRPPFIAPTKPRLGRPPNPNKAASAGRGSRGRGARGGRGRRGGLPVTSPRPPLPSQIAALQAIQNAQAQVSTQLQQNVNQSYPLSSVNPALVGLSVNSFANPGVLNNQQQTVLDIATYMAAYGNMFSNSNSFLQQNKDNETPPMDLSPTPKTSLPNLNIMRLIPPSPNPYASIPPQQYLGMSSPNPYASVASPVLPGASSPIATAASSPKTTPQHNRPSAGSPAEAGSVSPAATPRSAAPAHQTAPSPRPARSPAPASPSTPNLCSPTPEVTITKLSPASTSVSTTKSTTTNTISITKRSGVSITASSSSDVRSSNKSGPGKPSSNPALTKMKTNTVTINAKSPKSSSNSPVSSPKLLNGKLSINLTPNKKSLSTNGLTFTSTSNMRGLSIGENINKLEVSRSGHSPLNESGPLPATSSILKIESLTRSLPPATGIPLAVNGSHQ
ncbi:flocculation protein FLO11 [Hyalella azteca]|uniref:Flocculation protein FLO11 n=1 Tax=Hyalella azteca TaxID=294128 RepID=A0A8B7N8D7_HYAAZ|nr:flocculation protein FLO11 [Hyalella azteca]